MLHTLYSPSRAPCWDNPVPLSRTRVPENTCDGVTVQRPCRSGSRRRLCGVNVKLTMSLPPRQAALGFADRVAWLFSRFPARRKQVASNRLVRSRGGVGVPPRPRTEDQSDKRQGVLSTLPLFFAIFLGDCALARRGKRRLFGRIP